MIFFDTETCGLHGMMVLYQWAKDDGDIYTWNIWKNPIGETLELLEKHAQEKVCGFNLVFDWFHISKIYTIFSMFSNYDAIPEEHIEELAILEEKARLSKLCIKPRSALDLMLHARKGPFQSLMERSDIRIKRIPSVLAEALQRKLEEQINLDGIYFAKRKNPHLPQWGIYDIQMPNGDIDPHFKDIVLRFRASSALKVLAQYILGVEEDFILQFTDIEPDSRWAPNELGYAPFALAIGKPGKWRGAWPEVIKQHISHWAFNPLAIEYAKNDVKYTRDLYHYFGKPESGDNDSILACMVGAARWRGFRIDTEALQKQKGRAREKFKNTPTAPRAVKAYLSEVMNESEELVLQSGTKAVILESIAGRKGPDGDWYWGWLKDDDPHPAAIRAKEVIDARRAQKEIELYDKLIRAGRFHASFNVIGTRSSRMSGSDDLNAQGIKSSKEVRSCFLMAEDDYILCGGDFDQFEVAISEAVYKDPKLHQDLMGGKKIHALFAQELFPDLTYEEIVTSKGSETKDYYTDGKRGVFGLNYGGTAYTLETKLGISKELARKAYEGFAKRYPGIGRARERIREKFCSMQQPGGIGTEVEWHEPADYIESLLGFRRYFTLENEICKALYNLAQNPPKAWRKVKIKLCRRDRLQTAAGAVQSALYAAAFNIQATNMRAAANHEIQSTGAQITKAVQRRIWDLQPHGVYVWLVQPFNVHDEVIAPLHPDVVEKATKVVAETVEKYRPVIPLIKMDWNIGMKSWAQK